MNCGDCGTKLTTISRNHGIVAFCPKCVPSVEHAFSSRGEPMVCIKLTDAKEIIQLIDEQMDISNIIPCKAPCARDVEVTYVKIKELLEDAPQGEKE